MRLYTSSGTFSPETNTLFGSMVGGGAGGGPRRAGNSNGCGGGGAGESCSGKEIMLSNLDDVPVTIGDGGDGGVFVPPPYFGSNGTATTFGSYLSVQGGYGGDGAGVIGIPSTVGKGGGCGAPALTGEGGEENGVPANKGHKETNRFFGGSSGAGCIPNFTFDLPGADCGPYKGGICAPHGVADNTLSGGGGGATEFGNGGQGGTGIGGTHSGNSPPSNAKGAGGGGSSGATPDNTNISAIGGPGRSGRALFWWIHP